MNTHCLPNRSSALPSRLLRCVAALGLAVSLAACSGGSDSTSALAGLEETQASNIVMVNDAPGLQLKGQFESVEGYLSESSKVLRSVGSGPASATFSLAVPQRGFYEVFAWWPQAAPEGSTAQVVVGHLQGETATTVDQSVSGGDWNSLGIFEFDPAQPGSVTLSKAGNSPLLVDAVRFHYVGGQRPDLQLPTEALPLADQDREFLGQVAGWGGLAPYSYRIVDGALPPGLSLNDTDGTITGIPAVVGRHEFSVEVADAAGNRSVKLLTIEVLETPDTVPAEDAQLGPISGKRTKSVTSSQTLAEIVSRLPEGEWAQLNLNSYSSVWTPAAQRPLAGSRNPTPESIIKAWSSFAWDSRRGNLILYGGGHANYRGNDVYIWNGSTRMWQRGSLPSEMKRDVLGNWNAIDGHDKAPASAHTYDNSEYLPIVDRFITLGGAADANGGHFFTQETATTSRRTGPYMFDPSRAHSNKVGGTTGSHVQRVAPYPEVVGGNMWSNRENWLNPSTPPSNSFVMGCTAYAEEGGKDVLYVRTRYGLFRYTIHDLGTPSLDTWQTVGRYWNGPSSQGPCGYDPVGKSLVRVTTNAVPFVYWNLNTPGPKNNDVNVVPTDPTGEFPSLLSSNAIDLRYCGLDFDRSRGHYALWCGDGRVWALKPPATLSASGWVITKQPIPVLAVPNGSVGTGILGKWKYIASLDVFMGMQDAVHGNVWIYKPIGWSGTTPTDPGDPGDPGDPEPGPSNLPPAVTISQPTDGTLLLTGQPVTVSANASDSDGSVVKVEFFRGVTKIGEDLAAPFQITWASPPSGNFNLTAMATDDKGASTVSSPVAVSVTGSSGAGTAVLQRGLHGYSAATDTYLSSYHKSLSFGSSALMQDAKSYYSILARFAIFQSEGGPVPNGAAIQSARLAFYKSTSYNMVYGVHRLLKDWQEGSASWSQTGASGAWSTAGANGAGADYLAAADATASTDFDPGWIEFDVTAAVQQMSSSASPANFGWRLRAISGYTSGLKKFHTSEYGGNAELRPKLTVSYQ